MKIFLAEPWFIGCENDKPDVQFQDCYHDNCPHWSIWHQWSPCSRSCAGGFHVRQRLCVRGEIGEVGCEESDSTEKESCETQNCPSWSLWSSWSSCDQACGKVKGLNLGNEVICR